MKKKVEEKPNYQPVALFLSPDDIKDKRIYAETLYKASELTKMLEIGQDMYIMLNHDDGSHRFLVLHMFRKDVTCVKIWSNKPELEKIQPLYSEIVNMAFKQKRIIELLGSYGVQPDSRLIKDLYDLIFQQ